MARLHYKYESVIAATLLVGIYYESRYETRKYMCDKMQSFLLLEQVVPTVTTGFQMIQFLTRRSCANEPNKNEISLCVV
jgi:hypothetical protein